MNLLDSEVRDKYLNIIVTNGVRFALILLLIRAYIIGDHSQDFIALITLAMTYYPSILAKQFGVYLPNSMQIIITSFIFAAQYLGEIKDFYYVIPYWDLILHSISGILLGTLGFMFVYLLNAREDEKIKLSPKFVVVFAFCFGLSIGVFGEFFEFGVDRILGGNMQKFRMPDEDGLIDTMIDLFVDAGGALVACIAGWFYIKKKNDVSFSKVFSTWFRK